MRASRSAAFATSSYSRSRACCTQKVLPAPRAQRGLVGLQAPPNPPLALPRLPLPAAAPGRLPCRRGRRPARRPQVGRNGEWLLHMGGTAPQILYSMAVSVSTRPPAQRDQQDCVAKGREVVGGTWLKRWAGVCVFGGVAALISPWQSRAVTSTMQPCVYVYSCRPAHMLPSASSMQQLTSQTGACVATSSRGRCIRRADAWGPHATLRLSICGRGVAQMGC